MSDDLDMTASEELPGEGRTPGDDEETFTEDCRAHFGRHLHKIGDAVASAVLAMDEQNMDGFDASMTVVSDELSKLREHRTDDFVEMRFDEDSQEYVSAYPRGLRVQVFEVDLSRLIDDLRH